MLLGTALPGGKKISVALNVPGKQGILGSRVEIQNKDGKRLAAGEISEATAAAARHPRRCVSPSTRGNIAWSVRLSSGETRSQDITVATARFAPSSTVIKPEAP